MTEHREVIMGEVIMGSVRPDQGASPRRPAKCTGEAA
jgi:hypothetical protein